MPRDPRSNPRKFTLAKITKAVQTARQKLMGVEPGSEEDPKLAEAEAAYAALVMLRQMGKLGTDMMPYLVAVQQYGDALAANLPDMFEGEGESLVAKIMQEADRIVCEMEPSREMPSPQWRGRDFRDPVSNPDIPSNFANIMTHVQESRIALTGIESGVSGDVEKALREAETSFVAVVLLGKMGKLGTDVELYKRVDQQYASALTDYLFDKVPDEKGPKLVEQVIDTAGAVITKMQPQGKFPHWRGRDTAPTRW